jgi:hypothetical protein
LANALLAGPLVDTTDSPHGRVVLVQLAIAIVVKTVAHFIRWPHSVDAKDFPVDALEFPDLAQTSGVATFVTAFRIAIVDVTVTIIVAVVAKFSGTGIDPGVLVIAIAQSFSSVFTTGKPIAVIVEGFVDEIVTIVINSVAALRRAGIDMLVVIVALVTSGKAVIVVVIQAGNAAALLAELAFFQAGYALARVGGQAAAQVAALMDGTLDTVAELLCGDALSIAAEFLSFACNFVTLRLGGHAAAIETEFASPAAFRTVGRRRVGVGHFGAVANRSRGIETPVNGSSVDSILTGSVAGALHAPQGDNRHNTSKYKRSSEAGSFEHA